MPLRFLVGKLAGSAVTGSLYFWVMACAVLRETAVLVVHQSLPGELDPRQDAKDESQ
jgi:hypothetical protein